MTPSDGTEQRKHGALAERARRALAQATDLRDPVAVWLTTADDGATATLHGRYRCGSRLTIAADDNVDATLREDIAGLCHTAWERLGHPPNTRLAIAPGTAGRETRVEIRTRNPRAEEGVDVRHCAWGELRALRRAREARRQTQASNAAATTPRDSGHRGR